MIGGVPSLAIPAIAELAEWRRWVLWHKVERRGKATKRPIAPDGVPASSTDSSTWYSYREACRALVRGVGEGVGFVLTETPFAGVDLDGCVGSDGSLNPQAETIVNTLDSYTEYSPSGRGLHVLVRGALEGPGRNRRDLGVEVYDTGRYLTVTGLHVAGAPQTLEPRDDALRWLVREVLGEAQHASHVAGRQEPRPWSGELPGTVRVAAQTDATVRLILTKRHRELGYASPSEADYALACTLLEAGFEDADVEAALRWRHARTEPRPKSLDYFPRTVGNAREAVGRRAAK